MAILFSPLLAGETLHNNFSRYAEEVGLSSLYSIYKIMSGSIRNNVRNIYRPALNFQKLALETEICWGMSAAEILRGHTFFQYDTLFLGNDERKRRLKEATHDGMRKRRVITANYQDQSFARYCDKCIEEAKRSGLPGYFQLMHQLPYVVVCPIHETLLSVFPVDIRSLHSYQPLSFSKLKKEVIGIPIKNLGTLYFPGFLDVARRSQVALEGDGECMRNFPYSTLLEDGGLKHKGGALKVRHMTDAMYRYYGVEFCVSAGITSPDVWKATISADWKTAPYRQILMQSFLAFRVSGAGEFMPRISHENHTFQEVDCGGALHRVEDNWLERRLIGKGGDWVLTCSCTRSLRVRYEDNGRVAQTSIHKYGKQYFDEFSRLVKSGLSAQVAGRRLGVHESAARDWENRLLLPERLQTASHQRVVRCLRRTWVACVRKQLGTNRLTRAYADCRYVYDQLQLYDRGWVRAFNRKYKDRGLAERKSAQWEANAIVLLKSAHTNLLALERPVRITWKKLVETLGVANPWDYSRNDEIAALRKELCESAAEFRERLFSKWLESMARNRPRTRSQFMYVTGLSSLSPDQKKRLDAWLQKST